MLALSCLKIAELSKAHGYLPFKRSIAKAVSPLRLGRYGKLIRIIFIVIFTVHALTIWDSQKRSDSRNHSL